MLRSRALFAAEIKEPQARGVCSIEGDAGDAGGDSDGGEPAPPKTDGVVTMPKGTFNERLARAKSSGQKELLDLLGAKDTDELKRKLARVKDLPDEDEEESPKTPPKTPPPERDWKAEAQRQKKALDAAKLEREEAVEQERTQRQLEGAAIRAGIDDTDYALRLCQKHVAGLDEKALAKFDPKQWFRDLAKSKPFLCTPDEIPATTGTGGNGDPEKKEGAPPPKKPGSKDVAFNAMAVDRGAAQRRLDELRRGK